MGFGTRLLQFGLAAAAGTGKGLADHYEAIRQEQEYLAKLREQRILEQWKLGETDRMERGRMQFEEDLPSKVASTRQATTAADENVARSTLLGAQATSEPIEAEARRLAAETAASQERRLGESQGETLRRAQGGRTEAERAAQAERRLKEIIQGARPGKDYEAVLNGKDALDLNTENSPVLKDWFDKEYPKWLPPAKKEGEGEPGADPLIDFLLQEVGSALSGGPAAPIGAAGALPAGTAPPPRPLAQGTDRYGGALGAGPPAGAPVGPPTAPTTPGPENTAGLDAADVQAVRQAMVRWGISFNEARSRLEGMSGAPR